MSQPCIDEYKIFVETCQGENCNVPREHNEEIDILGTIVCCSIYCFIYIGVITCFCWRIRNFKWFEKNDPVKRE